VRLVFFLDVDNTLLDNDALKTHYQRELGRIAGEYGARRFWEIYEEIRAASDVIDYPATLARFLDERPGLSAASLEPVIMDAPFTRYVYPGALALIQRIWDTGEPVILSDGDPVYQPRKIERAGLAAAARGNVLVYAHKQDHLDEILSRFPADHYVQVDDKASLLATTKRRLDGRVTTVHVRQGHYAVDPPQGPSPDLTIERIADLVDRNVASLPDFA
jgi:FMN phosphatase YigB (HAD superfamily)